MKLLLLKTLLQRRARDDGYVLPMVIAIGLVMMLLGIVNMTSAKEENFNAIIQNSRFDALGIAEVGVAKYREMLDRNRILTVYNRDQWTSNNVNGVNVAGQTCNVITDTADGWANNDYDGQSSTLPFNTSSGPEGEDYWRAITLNETLINQDLNQNGNATDTNVNIGWYKIVDYEYDIDGNVGDADGDGVLDDTNDNGVFSVLSDANTSDDDPADPNFGSLTVANRDENDNDDDGFSDARGILTVKGRTPDGSEAQIQVEIPLRINQQDMNNLAPALWLGNGNTGNLGGLVVGDSDGDNITDDLVNNLTGAAGADGIPDVNIVASSPNDGTNNGCNDIASVNNNTIVTDPRGLPPIDAITQTVNAADTAALASGENINFDPAAKYLGELDDFNYCAAPEDCRYYYKNVTAITGKDYETDGVAKVTLYNDGDIAITATADMTIESNVSSNFLEIYSTQNIDINTGGHNVTINALIHTPGILTINGGGTLTINGSVWAGTFVNGITTLGAVKINPDNTDSSSTASDKSYEFYTTTSNRTPRPLTGSPTNWKTEEVN